MVRARQGSGWKVLTVEEDEQHDMWVQDGGRLENVLIDVTASGATARILCRGEGWRVRNVAIRGQQASEPALSALNVQGSGKVEHCYFGDGAKGGEWRGLKINGDVPRAKRLRIIGCNFSSWPDSGIRAKDPLIGELSGKVEIEECFLRNNDQSHITLSTEGSEISRSVIYNSGDVRTVEPDDTPHSRGIWSTAGSSRQKIEVRECDIGVTKSNTGGDAATLEASAGATELHVYNTDLEGPVNGDSVRVYDVGDDVEITRPGGVPYNAEGAIDAPDAAWKTPTRVTTQASGSGVIDDFEHGDLASEYVEGNSGDLDFFSLTQNQVHGGSYALQMIPAPDSPSQVLLQGTDENPNIPEAGDAWRKYMYIDAPSDTDLSRPVRAHFGVPNYDPWENGYIWGVGDGVDGDSLELLRRDGGGQVKLDYDNFTVPTREWFYADVYWQHESQDFAIVVNVFDGNGQIIGTVGSDDTMYSSGQWGHRNSYGLEHNQYVDMITHRGLSVSIDGSNSPVRPGDVLDVDVSVLNDSSVAEEEDIELYIE